MFSFLLLKTKFTNSEWLACKTYGVHSYILHLYTLLENNKLKNPSSSHVYTTLGTPTITRLNTWKEPGWGVIVTHLCYSCTEAWNANNHVYVYYFIYICKTYICKVCDLILLLQSLHWMWKNKWSLLLFPSGAKTNDWCTLTLSTDIHRT